MYVSQHALPWHQWVSFSILVNAQIELYNGFVYIQYSMILTYSAIKALRY